MRRRWLSVGRRVVVCGKEAGGVVWKGYVTQGCVFNDVESVSIIPDIAKTSHRDILDRVDAYFDSDRK